jgi:hypothetical protein
VISVGQVDSEETALGDLEKPSAAAPVTTECGEPAAFAPRPAPYRVAGSTPTIDGALYLAAEVLWPETWPARHNAEIWGTRPDGIYGDGWKNDATGHSYEDSVGPSDLRGIEVTG